MKEELTMEHLKNDLRRLSPETLAAHGFLAYAKNGGFVCPDCQNGTGEDGTGLMFNQSGDTFLAHCFRCGKGWDTLGVIRHHFNGVPFGEMLKLAADEFGISTFADHSHQEVKFVKNSKKPAKEEKNFSRLISAAQKNLNNFLENQGGSYRGLSKETLEKFRVGFLPKVGIHNLPRIIIPTFSDAHYLARLTLSENDLPENLRNSVRAKQHFGQKDIFNFEDLQKAATNEIFFAVEGEFDAMSICQVGFNAIAFSSCQISKFQKAQLETLEHKPPRIVILFDDDAAGKQNAENAVKALQRLHIGALSASLDFGTVTDENGVKTEIKDANDALRFSPELLAKRLQEISDDASKKFENREKILRHSYEIRNSLRNSQEIFPDCPVDVFIPEGYYVRENGVFKIFKTHEPEIICFAPIFVSKIFTSSDFEEKKIELVIFDRRRNLWHKKVLRDKDIMDYRNLTQKMFNFGAAATPKDAQRLCKYFLEMIYMDENRDRIEDVNFFQKTGWLQDNFAEFVFPTDIDGKYPVFKGNFDFAAAFKAHGDFQKSLDVMRVLLHSSTTSRIVLGAVFAAPLVRPFGVRNPQLHLCAKSGSGKSAVIKAAISAFGNPALLRQTFANTQKFIEELPAKFNDLPVWIDELQSLNKFARLNIDDQVYNFENGITRGRLTKDAEEKPQAIFAGVRITSGEQPLTNFTSGQGAKNRVIEIDFDNILSSRDAIKIHKMFMNSNTAAFGHFGRKYVEWLADKKNMRMLESFFDETCYKIRAQAAFANGYEGKLKREVVDGLSDEIVGLIPAHVQMLALFLTATFAFSKMAFANDEKISKSIVHTLDEDIDCFVNNFSTSKLTTTAERALPAILETRLTYADRFQHLTADGKIVSSLRTPTLGIDFGDGCIGFYPAQFNAFISELGFNAHEIIRGMSELEILDEGNSAKHLHQKSVQVGLENGEIQSRWLFVVSRDAEEVMERRRKEKTKAFAAG